MTMLVPYAIKKNDTLWQIAGRYKMTLNQLLQINPQIHDPDNVPIGTIIKVQVDTSIAPGDIQIAPDIPMPPQSPYIRTKDNGIIELPAQIKLPYRGLTRITQEYADRAGVMGCKGQGYYVTIGIGGESESPGAAAAKELGGSVAKEAAGKAAEHYGIMPKLPSPIGIILDVFTPTPLGGYYKYFSHAIDGTYVSVTITYPTNQGILDSIF